jgi:hypothetical protein
MVITAVIFIALAVMERQILYWYNPLNPDYRSDKRGKAPDGINLVQKYADDK